MIEVVAADIVIDAHRLDETVPPGTYRQVPAWFVIRDIGGRDVIDIIVDSKDRGDT